MIAYLLCAPSQQASKNTLKDLFWIDAGEKAAYNLRFNLWNIRKYIPEVDGENFIVTSGGTCRINPDYPVQKGDLEKLAGVRGELFGGDLIGLIETGSRLTFMEHFYLKDCDDFNDWLVLERNNREREIVVVLSNAEKYFEEQGEFHKALSILEKMTFLSPFEDDFHLRIMKIHEKLGNFGEAVREYKQYGDRLKKELGVAPSKSLRETYLSIAQSGEMDIDGIIHIKDNVYDSDFAAATEMLKEVFHNERDSVPVQIDNWNNLDPKSKEF